MNEEAVLEDGKEMLRFCEILESVPSSSCSTTVGNNGSVPFCCTTRTSFALCPKLSSSSIVSSALVPFSLCTDSKEEVKRKHEQEGKIENQKRRGS